MIQVWLLFHFYTSEKLFIAGEDKNSKRERGGSEGNAVSAIFLAVSVLSQTGMGAGGSGPPSVGKRPPCRCMVHRGGNAWYPAVCIVFCVRWPIPDLIKPNAGGSRNYTPATSVIHGGLSNSCSVNTTLEVWGVMEVVGWEMNSILCCVVYPNWVPLPLHVYGQTGLSASGRGMAWRVALSFWWWWGWVAAIVGMNALLHDTWRSC